MRNVTEELETMIDETDLQHVLVGLSLVCAEKAEHLLANWQDPAGAKAWSNMATLIERVAHKCEL
jgi:hypothetical protein